MQNAISRFGSAIGQCEQVENLWHHRKKSHTSIHADIWRAYYVLKLWLMPSFSTYICFNWQPFCLNFKAIQFARQGQYFIRVKSMRLTVLILLCATLWRLNYGSLQPDENGAIGNEGIQIGKRGQNRPPCWFGRCRRRKSQKGLVKKVN